MCSPPSLFASAISGGMDEDGDPREEMGRVEVLLRPGATFSRMQPEGSVSDSLLFGLFGLFLRESGGIR
ncbi:hypothetical protein [Myxococcus landrumensis]|uniref:Uncharacterized protein n=1 Tax=Myxococcus landrumensis TaxID=2813577 RepID=A0ABX7N0N0_9BACT|nr:hypothetical protein [Myxococcus landrumus]QSQ12270.1 hypothetical protein JY572_28425 [Myxococcus landrumus]